MSAGLQEPKSGVHETKIRSWSAAQHVGVGPIKVIAVDEVVGLVREVASSKQYRDNAALVAMKVMEAAGVLNVALPQEKTND